MRVKSRGHCDAGSATGGVTWLNNATVERSEGVILPPGRLRLALSGERIMVGKRRTFTWVVTPAGCHECTSHVPDKTTGYPKLGDSNMHRVLYEETFGLLPKGIVCRHKCDNPLCINLEHIEPGTFAENSNDMRVRGRCNTSFGEQRSDAKLTDEQVREIRASDELQDVLAERYNVTQPTILRIKAQKKRVRVQ